MPSAVRWAKILNESKGPAVHSLRAQADKQEYTRSMRRVLENTDHLTIRQAEVAEILTEEIPGECGTFKKEHEGQQESSYPVKKRIVGVKTYSGSCYRCLSPCKMYLRRCEQPDGTEWSAGGEPSDRFLKGERNRNVPF